MAILASLSSGMRAFVGTAILLLQLQPVLGVALCGAMGGSDGKRMEAGCPMPEAEISRYAYHTDRWSAPNISHECVFAEACTPAPTLVHSARLTILALPLQFAPSVRLPDLLLPTEGRSPPVPPPKP